MSEKTADLLNDIAHLAKSHRLVRLGYRRAGDAMATEYLVELYRLHHPASGPVLHGRQIAPERVGRSPWRDFRLDRVTTVADSGQSFAPRIPVTLLDDLEAVGGVVVQDAPPRLHVWGTQPIVAVGAADDYLQFLEAAMLDGQVTPEELAGATALGERVEPHERKAVHARVYANVLAEVVQDGRITHREELLLGQVRELLARLGWAP